MFEYFYIALAVIALIQIARMVYQGRKEKPEMDPSAPWSAWDDPTVSTEPRCCSHQASLDACHQPSTPRP
jgi:hypothetical protein